MDARPLSARAGEAIAWTAALGAACTLGVLAISVWLRVNTSLDGAGVAATNLDATTQEFLRRIHRVTASAVGLLALALAVLLVRGRAKVRPPWAAFAVVMAATLALAAIGRLTPGYRLSWVTVANVTAAIALAAAFWWIRESARGCGARLEAQAFALATAMLALLQAAFGALASAACLHGGAVLDPWHVASGLVVLAFCIVAAARAQAASAAPRAVAAMAVGLQFATGWWLAAAGEPGAPTIALLHALGAALIVLAAMAMLMRAPRRPPAGGASDSPH